MGEEKRHEMMETLFGAESEDSDDEPETVRQAVSDQGSDRSVSFFLFLCFFFLFILSTIASSPPSPSVSRIVSDRQPSQLSGHARTTGRSSHKPSPGISRAYGIHSQQYMCKATQFAHKIFVVKFLISLTLDPSYSLQRI